MAGFEGGCLCGAVRYRSEADPVLTAHCHCEDCRRTSGTGHGTHVVIPTGALTQNRIKAAPSATTTAARKAVLPLIRIASA